MKLTVKSCAGLLLWGWFTGGWILFRDLSLSLSLSLSVCMRACICVWERKRETDWVKNNARCMSTIFVLILTSADILTLRVLTVLGTPPKTTMLVRVPLMPCMQKTSRSGLSSISQLWDFKSVCLFNIKIKNVPLFTVSFFHVPLLIRLTVPPAEICVEKAKVTGETFHTGSWHGRTPSSIKQRICFTLSDVFRLTAEVWNTWLHSLFKAAHEAVWPTCQTTNHSSFRSVSRFGAWKCHHNNKPVCETLRCILKMLWCKL